MRSLSLTRSSAAPVTANAPSAKAAATASAGTSSISEGTSAGSTVVPWRRDEDATIDPTGSGSLAVEPGLDRAAHGPEHVDERGAGRGEQHAVEPHLGVGQDERGHHQEGRARGVAGDGARSVPRRRAPPCTLAGEPVAPHRDAEGRQHALGVVAAGRRLADRRACPRPAGPRAARRSSPGRSRPAGRGRCPAARPPSMVRGAPAVGRQHGRAHGAQRGAPRARAAAGAATRRRSAPCGTAGRRARRRACGSSSPSSPRRERPRGRASRRAPRPSIVTLVPSRRIATPSPRRQASVEAQSAALEKLRDARLALGHRAEEGGAVRDGLVAGKGEPAAEERSCLDPQGSAGW